MLKKTPKKPTNKENTMSSQQSQFISILKALTNDLTFLESTLNNPEKQCIRIEDSQNWFSLYVFTTTEKPDPTRGDYNPIICIFWEKSPKKIRKNFQKFVQDSMKYILLEAGFIETKDVPDDFGDKVFIRQ